MLRLKLQYFVWCEILQYFFCVIRKDPDSGKAWRQDEKGTTENEVVVWYHWLNEYDFEQVLGDGDGQGSLVAEVMEWQRVRHDWVTKQHHGFVY